MKQDNWFNKIISFVLLFYPVIVFIGLKFISVQFFGLILAVIVAARLIFKPDLGPIGNKLISVSILAIVINLVGALLDNQLWIKLYPFLMNATLFFVFAQSLVQPPSLIEQIARLKEKEFPLEGILYTKKVTMIWCGFFVLNGAMALYTVFWTSLETWTLYNGLISYVLIGFLLSTEWLYRRFVMLPTLKKNIGNEIENSH